MKAPVGAPFVGMVLARTLWLAVLWWALAGGTAWAFGARSRRHQRQARP